MKVNVIGTKTKYYFYEQNLDISIGQWEHRHNKKAKLYASKKTLKAIGELEYTEDNRDDYYVPKDLGGAIEKFRGRKIHIDNKLKFGEFKIK